MKNLTKEMFMYVLGGFVILCTAGIIFLLAIHAVPQDNMNIVNIAIGALMTMAGTVVNYFFGSSKSSSDKNELLAQAQPVTTTNTLYPDGAAVKVDEFKKEPVPEEVKP